MTDLSGCRVLESYKKAISGVDEVYKGLNISELDFKILRAKIRLEYAADIYSKDRTNANFLLADKEFEDLFFLSQDKLELEKDEIHGYEIHLDRKVKIKCTGEGVDMIKAARRDSSVDSDGYCKLTIGEVMAIF